MVDFIGYLIIGSLWCFGIVKIFDDVLSPVASWIELKIGVFWCKPLFYCAACMGSFHGFIIGSIIWGMSGLVPLYMICLCGLNYIIIQLIPE